MTAQQAPGGGFLSTSRGGSPLRPARQRTLDATSSGAVVVACSPVPPENSAAAAARAAASRAINPPPNGSQLHGPKTMLNGNVPSSWQAGSTPTQHTVQRPPGASFVASGASSLCGSYVAGGGDLGASMTVRRQATAAATPEVSRLRSAVSPGCSTVNGPRRICSDAGTNSAHIAVSNRSSASNSVKSLPTCRQPVAAWPFAVDAAEVTPRVKAHTPQNAKGPDTCSLATAAQRSLEAATAIASHMPPTLSRSRKKHDGSRQDETTRSLSELSTDPVGTPVIAASHSEDPSTVANSPTMSHAVASADAPTARGPNLLGQAFANCASVPATWVAGPQELDAVKGAQIEIERLRYEREKCARVLLGRCGGALTAPATPTGADAAEGAAALVALVARAPAAGTGEEKPAGERMLAVAEGLQHQLQETMTELSLEKREREVVTAVVKNLEQRLTDGLASMGQVAVARSATDGATEAVLSALRRCVDELGVQCAWPPDGATGGEPVAPTLSEAVQQLHAQLHQLQKLQDSLQARCVDQQEHAAAAATLMAEQHQRLEEGIAAITAATSEWPGRHQALASSVQMLECQVAKVAEAAGIEHLESCEQMAAACSISNGTGHVGQHSETSQNDTGLMALREQVNSLVSERDRAAEAFLALREQQQRMLAHQQLQEQELKNLQLSMQASTASSSSATAACNNDNALQELRVQVTMIASAVNTLCNRVDKLNMQDPRSALQTEMGAIANVVTKLAERVDRLDPQDAAPVLLALQDQPDAGVHTLHAMNREDPAETAQALRRKLAALVGDVQRTREERREAEIEESPLSRQLDMTTERLPALHAMAAAQKAPSPRRWLMEPLSVSVARFDTSFGAPTASAAPVISEVGDRRLLS